MELLGVEGKEEVEALAILNKFSADHCQVSYLGEKMQMQNYGFHFRQRDLM